ncbi:MAG: hypothetical protein QXE13_02395 [Sulfolobales archaeon]
MSEEISGYIKKMIDRIANEGYFTEILVHPDIDSVLAASMILRLASLKDYEIGVSASELSEEPSEKTLVIGFSRPKTFFRGYIIGKNKVFSFREDRIILIPHASSIARYVAESIQKIYTIPREMRSLALASYLYTSADNGMLHNLSDETVRMSSDIFGVDAARIVVGLKMMGFYDESYIDRNLINTIDPFIPGISGRRNVVSELMKEIGSGRGRDYIEKVSEIINTKINLRILEVGNKPYYEQSYPFIDPYEAVHCINMAINRDPVMTTLYIATGLSGISMISIKCKDDLVKVIETVYKIIEREGSEIGYHKIDNTRLVEISIGECSREILYEVYLILKDLKMFQETLVFRCGGRYLYPLRKPLPYSRDLLKQMQGMFIESDELKKISEVHRLIEDLYGD